MGKIDENGLIDEREEGKPSITPETDKEKPGIDRKASGSSVPKDTEKEKERREKERKLKEEKLKFLRECEEKLRREKEMEEKTEEEKRRQDEEARKKAKQEEKKRKEQKAEEERIEIEKERARIYQEEAKKGSPIEYYPELYSRIHSKLYTSYKRLDCARRANKYNKYDRGNDIKWYSKLPFKDFDLFVTETDCTSVDFSGLWGHKYQENPEDLKVLSRMALTVKTYTGEQKDNPYQKAFGDGFWKRSFYASDPNGFTEIVTAAQPSKIEFVHETLSSGDWLKGNGWEPKP